MQSDFIKKPPKAIISLEHDDISWDLTTKNYTCVSKTTQNYAKSINLYSVTNACI